MPEQLSDYILNQASTTQQWQPYIKQLQQQFALFMNEVPEALEQL